MHAQVSADLAQLGLLKQAFDFFDEDNSGGLYGDQLVRCLEAVDVRFDDCQTSSEVASRLSSLMRIIDKNADDNVSFPEFKGMVEGHILDHSIAGVHFVVVTLAEAEAIRAAIHHEQRMGGLTKADGGGDGGGDTDYSAVAISLGKTVIDKSTNWTKIFAGESSFRGNYMIDAATQVLRYLNSDLDFGERQRSMVLRTCF